MVVTGMRQFVAGVKIVGMSFTVLKKYPTLLALAALSPLWSLGATVGLFNVVTLLTLKIPHALFTFLFSFIAIIGFNFIYLSLLQYAFRLFEGITITLQQALWLSWQKIHLLGAWSLASTIINTAINTLTTSLNNTHFLVDVVITSVDVFWWLINFLIITAFITGNHTVLDALTGTVSTVITHFGTVLGAGGSILLLKNGTGMLLLTIIKYTPGLLTHWGIVTVTASEVRFFLMVVSVSGLIASACSGMIFLSAQAIAATTLYSRFIGKPAPAYEGIDVWSVIFLLVVLVIIFSLLAFSLASVVTLAALYLPGTEYVLSRFAV